jgi:hypothetical protein
MPQNIHTKTVHYKKPRSEKQLALLRSGGGVDFPFSEKKRDGGEGGSHREVERIENWIGKNI